MPPRAWPLVLALIALTVLAFLIPVVAFLQALQQISLLPGPAPTEDELRTQIGWLLTGAGSAGLGLVAAIVAIAASRRSVAPRVVGGFAIALSLIVAGTLSFVAWVVAGSLPQPPPPATEQAPDCGPESHPVVYGGDDRYTACPEDLAAGQAFVDATMPDLPTDDVTPDAMDAFAADLPDSSTAADAEYSQSIEAFDTVIAVWVPAPVTCAILTWDGTSWHSEVTGLLVDGGCVYLGG
ncbi:MAG TPA: hypothetical protein VNR36_06390 [Pseudolysinimonas sp.]|nr:hypothetical protein [Pseudolysinimonas sp.]